MVEIREEQECAEDGVWRESAASAGAREDGQKALQSVASLSERGRQWAGAFPGNPFLGLGATSTNQESTENLRKGGKACLRKGAVSEVLCVSVHVCTHARVCL